MPNSNTPNEPESNPACLAGYCASVDCDCPICVCRESSRAEAATRAPECEARTATEYCAREQAEIFIDERSATEYILREFSEALRRAEAAALRAIAYDRACHSPASIHCASTDRRDDNPNAARLEAFARAGRYAENSDKAIRATTERLREDTDTGPARAD